MQMYLEADVDTSILADEKIAILGYNSPLLNPPRTFPRRLP